MTVEFDVVDKLLAILFSLFIFVNAYIASKFARTWLTPSGMISIFWFGYSFFPLICLFSVPVNELAILYIFFAIFVFVLPSYFFNWHTAFIANKQKSKLGLRFKFHTPFLFNTFLYMQILVVIAIFLDVLAQGFSLRDVIFNLMETSSAYISLRYSDDIKVSILSRMGTVFTYVGSMLGGLVFCASRKIKVKCLVLFLSLFPSILVMVIQGAKGTLFLCAVLFYTAFLIYRLYSGNASLTDKRINKNIAIALMLLLPAIISSFLSRGLYDYDMDYIIVRLAQYFSSYAFAHLYAFSDWFSFYIGDSHLMYYEGQNDYYWGFYTFMSAFKLLGSTIVVPPGVYEEYYQYEDVIQSNIFTLFRGLILDFGILGSFVFMFLLGLICSASFYILLRTKHPYFSISFFITMAGFYYSSFIISVFIWNSIFFSFIIFALILYANNLFCKVKVTRASSEFLNE